MQEDPHDTHEEIKQGEFELSMESEELSDGVSRLDPHQMSFEQPMIKKETSKDKPVTEGSHESKKAQEPKP